MIWPALSCTLGIPAGLVLVLRLPICGRSRRADIPKFSIIIPARNEEQNLPRLLSSIVQSEASATEVLVVDDASTDNTASIARSFGARVLASASLPEGWTGKTWACHQGALAAATDLLFFLDADTYLLPEGLERILSSWVSAGDRNTVVSVLPYHAVAAAYEQLSIIFNFLMAAGAGGFGPLTPPSLFGQSLLVGSQIYFDAGGHAAVRNMVLENLRLSRLLRSRGAHLVSLAGRGTLHMRMFPEGYRQMTKSWSKAFVQGAKESHPLVVAFSILWISALWSCFFLLVWPVNYNRALIAAIYMMLGLLLYLQARQIGRYRLATCLLYPVPLAYYCAVFGHSMWRRVRGQRVTWKGREV